MERRELLLKMRKEHTLKGLKPAFVSLRINQGKIYSGPFGSFIMSLRDNVIYFQKISTFLKRLQPKYDFQIKATRFKSYLVITKSYYKCLYLYDEEGRYLEISYLYGTKNTASSDENIFRMIDELKNTINLVEVEDDREEEKE